MFRAQVGISSGLLDVCMAHEHLDSFKIHAAHDELRREVVAQAMPREVLHLGSLHNLRKPIGGVLEICSPMVFVENKL